ncbi:hypothetical protein ES332_D08G031400v1 [Gossypium tomentosum]|uniref:Uncharacterized protein n=1 Tax=Gossypium tomentosum TaxID=34277 RepID=A0A5D2JQ15_GOSTO|nr:hypothetical protein ES332_D08G031400v1 [Gossypium tomentosum]
MSTARLCRFGDRAVRATSAERQARRVGAVAACVWEPLRLGFLLVFLASKLGLVTWAIGFQLLGFSLHLFFYLYMGCV